MSDAHEAIEAPHESLALAAVSHTGFEEPASGEIPAAIPETPAPQLSSPLPSSSLAGAPPPVPETTEAILEPEDGAEPHDAKAAEQLAAMMAKEARGLFRAASISPRKKRRRPSKSQFPNIHLSKASKKQSPKLHPSKEKQAREPRASQKHFLRWRFGYAGCFHLRKKLVRLGRESPRPS